MDSNIVKTAVLASLSTSAFLGVLVFVFRSWVSSRIQNSIKHEYDKKLKLIEHQKEVRIKAELIAELMAEWIKPKPCYSKLNELSFKAFLWLTENLANDLSNSLAHRENAPDLRELINKVRKHLLGDDDNLLTQNVIVFKQK